VSAVDERVQLVRATAGDRYPELELNALVQQVLVVADRRRAAEKLAGHRNQLSPDEMLESPYVLVGTVDQIIDDLRARRARWGFSYFTIREPDIDAAAPIVAQLAGT
jgi:hypothetical protein